MYEAVADPYCYAGTDVLKDIPGIRDTAALERVEALLTTERGAERLPDGRLSVRLPPVDPWMPRTSPRLSGSR